MKKLNSKTLQETLSLVSKKIDLAKNNIEINELVEDLLTSLLDAEFASLWFYNEAEMALIRERNNLTANSISLEKKEGVIYSSFMLKEAKIYNYLASDKAYVAAIDNPDNIKIKSKIIFPLFEDSAFIGIVTVYNSIKKVKKFTHNDMAVLKALAPYLINTLCRMHPCSDEKRACCHRNEEEKKTLPIQKIENIEASRNVVESSEATLNSVANFVHDIRTPANTLHGFLELLEQQITDKRIKEYIINAKESAAFINELTSSMLERISLQREQEASELKELESMKFFANIAEMFVSNMYEKRIEFNIFIDPRLPKRIEVDELKLKRVIMNLIGNAYKFTPYGKSIEFAVKYNAQEKRISVYVKDKGIGIAKEKQETIFEAFKQAEETTSLQYGGTGLGLSICAEYVKELGGKLQLESEIDKGSSFYFGIPVKISDNEASFDLIDGKDIKITMLVSAKNSFSLLNIARYLLRMGMKKNNIIAVSSAEEIPEDTTHLIIYQHKLDLQSTQELLNSSLKLLIVEEQLFSIHDDEIDENCTVIPQFGYFANELYTFINKEIRPRVLIVDDDKTSVILLERILESEYCDIEIARNGKIALEMIIESHKKGSPYNVVYIDNNMPIMNGLEVMRRVREFEADNQLKPIFAVSTSGDMLDLKGQGKDFDAFVGKPFNIADIRKILYH